MTGLVLPSSLATPAQRFFQFDMGGFGSSFLPLRFDGSFIEEQRPHGPQVWRIGAGANMAFRGSVFARVGLFDERLGAGASGCWRTRSCGTASWPTVDAVSTSPGRSYFTTTARAGTSCSGRRVRTCKATCRRWSCSPTVTAIAAICDGLCSSCRATSCAW